MYESVWMCIRDIPIIIKAVTIINPYIHKGGDSAENNF